MSFVRRARRLPLAVVHLFPLALLPFAALARDGSGPGSSAPPPEPHRAERSIAVTIDDLPINGADEGLAALAALNDRLLAAIRRQGVPAVGFVNESKLYHEGEVDGRIALLRAWVEQGLELGNHTFSHPSLNKLGRAAFEEEVVRGETVTRLLLAARGEKLRWFRHPFLDAGASAEDKEGFERFLAGRGYRIAPVTLDAWDWYYTYRYSVAKRRGDQALCERIAAAYLAQLEAQLDYAEAFAKRLFGRDIPQVFLMHENEMSADHFDRVAEKVKARGYRFVTLEEAMADPAYGHADRYVGGGADWLVRWAVTDGIADGPASPRPPTWLETLDADRSPYDPLPTGR
jgi:peptidoglycan/xylan/chitin deacetylase (PgdA/CDA1 family)